MKTVCEPSEPATASVVESMVDELLLRIETAETEEERQVHRKELGELIESDPEAARTYKVHVVLERELRSLFEDPCYREEQSMSPWRVFWRRMKARIWPGPVG